MLDEILVAHRLQKMKVRREAIMEVSDMEAIFEMETELRVVSIETEQKDDQRKERKEMEVAIQDSDQEWIIKAIEPEVPSESKQVSA